MFVWLISHTSLTNEQYFFFTINQPTVLSIVAYQWRDRCKNVQHCYGNRDRNNHRMRKSCDQRCYSCNGGFSDCYTANRACTLAVSMSHWTGYQLHKQTMNNKPLQETDVRMRVIEYHDDWTEIPHLNSIRTLGKFFSVFFPSRKVSRARKSLGPAWFTFKFCHATDLARQIW